MLSIYQLKPAFQNLLRPGVKRLYDRGVTANQVTLFAAVVSVLLGTLLLALVWWGWQRGGLALMQLGMGVC